MSETIFEMLQDESVYIQGRRTRLFIRGDEDFEVLGQKGRGRTYTVQLYEGYSEADAVEAFETNESK